MTEAGKKLDEGKLRYDLIPPEALHALVSVLTFGATKYEDRNWEKGIKYSRVFAATMRHLWAWWRGETFDKETGFPHTWHALTNVAFLVTYHERRKEFDDRPYGQVANKLVQQGQADSLGPTVLTSNTYCGVTFPGIRLATPAHQPEDQADGFGRRE